MTTEENRRRLQRATLLEPLALVEQSADALRHSLAKCAPMELKTDSTMDELDHYEALSVRFARTADLYTQKLLKSLFMVLGEDAVSFLDVAGWRRSWPSLTTRTTWRRFATCATRSPTNTPWRT